MEGNSAPKSTARDEQVCVWGLGEDIQAYRLLPIENHRAALAAAAQWIEHWPVSQRSPVQFPLRAHAWVAGQVPTQGHMRGTLTLMFLSLSFSLPSPLPENK